jgi:predicted O-methyltransferase YrrM
MSTVGLEDLEVLLTLKRAYASDKGDEKWHNGGESQLGFGLIHYALIRNLRPENALVIGSRYGFVPACVALGLKANGAGRLSFVDANYDDRKDGYATAYGGVGYWSKPLSETFGALDLHPWVDVFLERTETYFERVTTKFEYIYIDGNHCYEGVKYDCEQALLRLKPGGLLAFHDAMVEPSYGAKLADPAAFGVQVFLKERFPEAIVLGRWPGLAIVQPRIKSP